MDDSQGHHRYDMMLGCDILSEPNIDLCFFHKTVRVNKGTYEGCTAPMKDVSKFDLNSSYDWLQDESIQNE